MGSIVQEKPKAGRVTEGLSVLRRGFTKLSAGGKKGVLKTAQGLLKVQRARSAAENATGAATGRGGR